MKGAFLGPFVQESRTMAHLALTRAFLQPATTALSPSGGGWVSPPLVPPFLLAQNLCSKRIAPIDNMRISMTTMVVISS